MAKLWPREELLRCYLFSFSQSELMPPSPPAPITVEQQGCLTNAIRHEPLLSVTACASSKSTIRDTSHRMHDVSFVNPALLASRCTVAVRQSCDTCSCLQDTSYPFLRTGNNVYQYSFKDASIYEHFDNSLYVSTYAFCGLKSNLPPSIH